jgi:integrase
LRGSIRKRSRDSWTLTVFAGTDPETGKERRRYATVKGTKKEAQAALTQMVAAVDMGLDFDSRHLTVAEYLIGTGARARHWEGWLEAKHRGLRPLKPRTHRRYAELIRLHVVPVIGNVRLEKLRPLHVEQVYARARENGLSSATVLQLHRVLSSALKQAAQWQLVPRNVAQSVKAPTASGRSVEGLEVKDAVQLIEALGGTELEVPAIVALGTGMRLGEVLGLRWRDLNLEVGEARVVQTLQITMEFDAPKSHRSIRGLAVPTFAVEALRRHRKLQSERRLLLGEAWNDLDLVFDKGDGSPIRPDGFSKRFSKAARKAGVALTFHGLRHTHASLMLAAGVDLKVTSDRLGHSSISITADTYSHVISTLDRDAAERLDALLYGRGQVTSP